MQSMTSANEDDFDSFLDSCGIAPVAKPAAASTMPSMSRQQTVTGNSKCYPLFIGGANLPDGHTSNSFAPPKSCSLLRCSACDKKVVRFADNVKWKDLSLIHI